MFVQYLFLKPLDKLLYMCYNIDTNEREVNKIMITTKCPNCGSLAQVRTISTEVTSDKTVNIKKTCGCGCTWVEIYENTATIILKKNEKNT